MKINKEYIPKLKTDINISEFDGEENKYIIFFNDSGHSIKINHKVFLIFKEIDGVKSLYEIFNKVSKDLSINDYITFESVFNQVFIEKKIIEGSQDFTKSKNIFLFSFKIINEQNIERFLKYTSILANLHLVIFTTIIFIITKLLFYTIKTESFSFNELYVPEIIILYFFSVITIFFHELGHVSFSKIYGAGSKFIGVGFYYFMFVFYADASEIWKLKKNQRCLVDFGGVYFQMIVGLILHILYYSHRLPVLYLGIILNDFGILINLLPVGKLDGYWLVKDYFGVTNLHKEAIRIILNTCRTSTNTIKKDFFFIIYYSIYLIFSCSVTIFIIRTFLFSVINYKITYFQNINSIIESVKTINFQLLKSAFISLLYDILIFSIVTKIITKLIFKSIYLIPKKFLQKYR